MEVTIAYLYSHPNYANGNSLFDTDKFIEGSVVNKFTEKYLDHN